MRSRVANRGYGKMWDVWILCVLCILFTVGTFSGWWWIWMHLPLCICSCVHQLGSVLDGCRSLAAWRQTDSAAVPPTPPPPMMDRTGGHTHTRTHTHTHTSWFIHNVVQKCSFGSSRDSADVTGHGLCTNYVRDSCEQTGPRQQSPPSTIQKRETTGINPSTPASQISTK